MFLRANRRFKDGKEHRYWLDRSAMADLLDDDFRLAAKDTLYRCHDHLLDHREALFSHLKERWAGLFGACYDILLYDLTSTYFEVDANGPVTEASKLKGDLGLRPVFHQLDGRIEAHVFISFLAYCLHNPRPKSELPSLWWRPFEKMNAISTIRILKPI